MKDGKMNRVENLVSLQLGVHIVREESGREFLAPGLVKALEELEGRFTRHDNLLCSLLCAGSELKSDDYISKILNKASEVTEARKELHSLLDQVLSSKEVREELKVDTTGLLRQIAMIVVKSA